MTWFEEACMSWQDRRLTQEEAARMLGVCERTFRRHIDRYEEAGLDGLIDRRIEEVSHRKAPVDEVVRLQALYKRRYEGWNVQHFYERYQGEHGGKRSYTWVKKRLQEAKLVEAGRRKGKHRKERPRSPLEGMLETIEAKGLFSTSTATGAHTTGLPRSPAARWTSRC